MTVDRTEEVEVRIAAEDSDGLTVGLRGERGADRPQHPGHVGHELAPDRTPAAGSSSRHTRRKPSGSARTSRPRISHSPPGVSPSCRHGAAKRFSNSHLSYKEIGPDGLIADSALPDKTIEIKVRANYGKLFKTRRILGHHAASWCSARRLFRRAGGVCAVIDHGLSLGVRSVWFCTEVQPGHPLPLPTTQ